MMRMKARATSSLWTLLNFQDGGLDYQASSGRAAVVHGALFTSMNWCVTGRPLPSDDYCFAPRPGLDGPTPLWLRLDRSSLTSTISRLPAASGGRHFRRRAGH